MRKFIVNIRDFLKISEEINKVKKKLGEKGQKVECTFANKNFVNKKQSLWVEGPVDVLDDFVNEINNKDFFIKEDYYVKS